MDATSTVELSYFTQPAILQQIGHRRLARLFQDFEQDLNGSPNVLLPPNPDSDSYFSALADALALTHSLPERLRKALFLIEQAATPENDDRLQATIQRRIPCISLSGFCPLDRAMELWFACPDELPQFTNGKDSSQETGKDAFHSVPISISSSIPAPLNGKDTVSTQEGKGVFHSVPIPTIHQSINPPIQSPTPPGWTVSVEAWPEQVSGKDLLDALERVLIRFVILPKWAVETLVLWILHTFAFELRDVTTYIGIESPVRRCGKTTLLTLLSRLVNRPVVAANVSSPALFRAIEELRPTLIIDEADTFFKTNDELQGILNAGYHRPMAYVLRVGQQLPASESKTQSSALAFFSCWCPKVISRIGRLPDTLADRCIIFQMQRKTSKEQCERLRNLEAGDFRRKCARFVADNHDGISNARPDIPEGLNDRAADIWEPLLVLADLAGGDWPARAREAALNLNASSQETAPIGLLLLDIFLFFVLSDTDRTFSRQLVEGLNARGADRPWMELTRGKAVTEIWLARQLRPYGISPRSIRVNNVVAKGYLNADFEEAYRRYLPKAELQALLSQPAEPDHTGTPDSRP